MLNTDCRYLSNVNVVTRSPPVSIYRLYTMEFSSLYITHSILVVNMGDRQCLTLERIIG